MTADEPKSVTFAFVRRAHALGAARCNMQPGTALARER
jgi:hypothetical protein